MKINNGILYLILLYSCYLVTLINSQYPSTSSTLTVKELLYNNDSTVFYSYPSTSNVNLCVFKIPFRASSSAYPISFYFSTGSSTSKIYNNNKDLAIDFQHQLVQDSEAQILLYVNENGASISFSFKVVSLGIDYSKVLYQVLDTGILYGSLAFRVKFDLLPPEYNITFYYEDTPNIRQYYFGNNQYVFLSQQNYDSYFNLDSNGNITLSFKYYYRGDAYYFISFKSPFKNSIGNPMIEYKNPMVSDSNYAEISNFNSPYNYFIAQTLSNSYYKEPYLISSQNNLYKYLVPLSSDYLYSTTYDVNVFKNSTSNLLLSKTTTYSYVSPQEPVLSVAAYSVNWVEISGTFINEESSYSFELGNPPKLFRYPYGLVKVFSSASILFTYPLPVPRLPSTLIYKFNKTPVQINLSGDGTIVSLPTPVISSYTIQLIPNGKMILFFNITNEQSIQSISIYTSDTSIYKTYSINELKPYNLGAELPQPQLLLPRISISRLVVKTLEDTTTVYNKDSLVVLEDNFKILPSVENIDQIQLSDYNYNTGLKNIRFLYNDLKVTNIGISNKMYLSLSSSYSKTREVKVTFIYSEHSLNEKKEIAYSYYNSSSSQFEFEFSVPPNTKPGQVSYIITLDSLDKLNYYSYSLPSEYQLRISESNNLDSFGPIITNYKIDASLSTINYNFEITDRVNGFKYGYMIIRSSIDWVERNVSINLSNLYAGTIYKGVYSINLAHDPICRSQPFTIVYAYLEDTQGYLTEYDIRKPSKTSPFYSLSSFNPTIESKCSPLPTADGFKSYPDLVSLKITSLNGYQFSTKEDSRAIYIQYTATHQDGISVTSLPKVYLSTVNNYVLESTSTNITSSNSTHTTFMAKIIIPFIYYYRFSFSVSIYGVVSRAGTVNGFTPSSLESKGLTSLLTITAVSHSHPFLTGSSKLSSSSFGGLWLYGYSLDLANYFQIQYSDDGSINETIKPDIVHSNALFFSSIRATNKPIKMNLGLTKDTLNDPFVITPNIFDTTQNSNNNNNNNNELCKGSPVCGGSSQGICISNVGCKCISPWIGEDCMSRVIQVPPPKINQTEPSTNISTTPVDSENSIFTNETINSIVSIIGIKELSVDSSEVNRYYFEEWIYKQEINDSYVTRYSYSSYIKKDKIKVSNIIVTLDWFKVESTIQFANEEIHLNPSTIKYTIRIDTYPFTSLLNTLQLIMKASIETDSTNGTCSNKQFGQSSIEDADYLKLQINNYSFYGRFIKRAQIDDNKVIKVTNSLLDSFMNETTLTSTLASTTNTQLSYIGINIPHFIDNAVIDPDFSILIDSKSLENCNGNGNSKSLTTQQLVGIIIGSVAFFVVLVIILSFIIYKSTGCLSIKIFIYKLFKK